MNRSLPSPGDPEGSNKRKFSQYEVQALIEQEVCGAVKKSEAMLQGLMETIQQLDRAIDYENTIRKLEAQINTVTQRAEAAMTEMARKKKKSPHPSLTDMDTLRLDSDDEDTEVISQKKNIPEGTAKSGNLFEIMDLTRKAFDQMHQDNKALMAAIEGLTEEGLPAVGTSHSSPQDNKKTNPEKKNGSAASPLKAVRVNECASPGDRSHQQHNSGQTKALYPPLPPITVPFIADTEAASFNIPQKPVVRLALIRNPANLSVLWDVVESDLAAPPMESYRILMTMEKPRGSGVFSKWITVGEVAAIPLPICVMVTKYKPGHKVCVAVVGKDKFGRYGPYSEVVTASIPD
ncbi:activating transcription factor 7-interacting protein 2 [Antennarius striatus]|uniref:activating transcription factor 7-interacting protein 2 n=1 Tax=Antennarius striatus TaxID=241820 RepID=UPI0035B0CED3